MFNINLSPSEGSSISSILVANHKVSQSENFSHLMSSVHRAKSRHKSCWKVPLQLVVYILFICAMIAHADSNGGYELNMFIQNCLYLESTLYPSANLQEVLPWISDSVVPSVLFPSPDNGTPAPSSAMDICSGGTYIVGGLKVSQWRAKKKSCRLESITSEISGDCYDFSSGSYDKTTFGDAAAVAQSNVVSSFSVPPSLKGFEAISPMDREGFHILFAPFTPYEEAQSLLSELEELSWVDAATQSVAVEFEVYNPQTALLGHVKALFSRTPETLVTSFVVTPISLVGFSQCRSLAAADVFLIIVALIGLMEWLGGVMSVLWRRTRGDPSASVHLRDFRKHAWALVDLFTFVSLISIAILLFNFEQKALQARAAANGDWFNNQDFSTGSGAQFDTLKLSGMVNFAISTWKSVVISAILTMIAMTFLGFRIMQLQPVMGLVSASIGNAFYDMIQLGAVLGFIMVTYGVIGYVAFGTEAAMYHTVGDAAFSIVLMFSCWDYDLEPMLKANEPLAKVFLSTFMFLMSNALMWVWFTVVIDAYCVAREKLREAKHVPSVMDDLNSGGIQLVKLLKNLRKWSHFSEVMQAHDRISIAHDRIIVHLDEIGRLVEDPSLVTYIWLAEMLEKRTTLTLPAAIHLLEYYLSCNDNGALQTLLLHWQDNISLDGAFGEDTIVRRPSSGGSLSSEGPDIHLTDRSPPLTAYGTMKG